VSKAAAAATATAKICVVYMINININKHPNHNKLVRKTKDQARRISAARADSPKPSGGLISGTPS
jgi:hypothetical protein